MLFTYICKLYYIYIIYIIWYLTSYIWLFWYFDLFWYNWYICYFQDCLRKSSDHVYHICIYIYNIYIYYISCINVWLIWLILVATFSGPTLRHWWDYGWSVKWMPLPAQLWWCVAKLIYLILLIEWYEIYIYIFFFDIYFLYLHIHYIIHICYICTFYIVIIFIYIMYIFTYCDKHNKINKHMQWQKKKKGLAVTSLQMANLQFLRMTPMRREVKQLLRKGTKAWWYVAEVVHFSKEKHQFMWSSCGQPFLLLAIVAPSRSQRCGYGTMYGQIVLTMGAMTCMPNSHMFCETTVSYI